MKRIEADLKLIEISNDMKNIQTDVLELVFIAAQRELNERLRNGEKMGGEIKARDAGIWRY